MEHFFRFDGRVDRQGYWMSVIVGLIVNSITLGILYFLLDAEAKGTSTSGLIAAMIFASMASIIVSIAQLSFQIRRWHDLNKSGLWVLVSLVPLFGGLYAFGMLGFVPGTTGANSYGDPFRREHGEIIRSQSNPYRPAISAKRAAEIERKTVV